MTVVLAGIAADSTNVGSLGPLYEDGRFEYVPIPEKTAETSERMTFGSWELRGRDGVASDLTTTVKPRPIRDGTERLTGSSIESWPVHHDPNFEALTYGEHRPGYVSRLRQLEPGDVVGFYAGLRRWDDGSAHRYLIGYFTVNEVAIITPDTPAKDRASILGRHPDNAHSKRANGSELFLSNEIVVIVDGREPGQLFERNPVRLSDYYVKPGNERPQYYLRESIEQMFAIRSGKTNMMFKPAYTCDVDADRFRQAVSNPADRLEVSEGGGVDYDGG